MHALEDATEIVITVTKLFGVAHVVLSPDGGQQSGKILLLAVFAYHGLQQ